MATPARQGVLRSERDLPIAVSECIEIAGIIKVENLIALAGAFTGAINWSVNGGHRRDRDKRLVRLLQYVSTIRACVRIQIERLRMAEKTIVDKAGKTVGIGIAMASDVAGAIKTAIGSALTTMTEVLKKEPVKGAAKKTATKKAGKKTALTKAGKKTVTKKAAKKPSVGTRDTAKGGDRK